MSGSASPAKAATGDAAVAAYLGMLPQPQRAIAQRIDALAVTAVPGLQRSVKWGIAFYGAGDGWCFACGAFRTHVKLAFMRGTSLTPLPPAAPTGMGKATRAVEPASLDAIDERQVMSWMKQAAALPGLGKS